MPKIPTIQIITTVVTLTLSIITASVLSQQDVPNSVAGINIDDLRTSGYRLDWMNQSNYTGISLPTITEDSIYTLNSEEYLTRYDLTTGKWIWSAPVGNQIYTIRSINENVRDNRVYIVSEGAVYVLERETGNFPTSALESNTTQAGSKAILTLAWFANTAAISPDGNFLIYGASNGDIVWFNPAIGFQIQRYKIGNGIKVNPTFAYGPRNAKGYDRKAVVTPSIDGQVIAVDAEHAKQIWSLSLTNPVEAEMNFGTQRTKFEDEEFPRTSVFIAGTDQYIRAIDLHSGKQRWNVLTSADLVDSPLYINETLYQRIPDVGLASYEAFPRLLSGHENWVSSEVTGVVLTTTKTGQLVCWDKTSRILQIVDPRKGGIVATLSLPTAIDVLTDNISEGSIYILTSQNALLRLVQRQ